MTRKQILGVISEFAQFVGHEADLIQLENSFGLHAPLIKENQLDLFAQEISHIARDIQLTFLKHQVKGDQFRSFIEDLEFPILIFQKESDYIYPVMLEPTQRGLVAKTFDENGNIFKTTLDELSGQVLTDDRQDVPFLVAFPFKGIVSQTADEGDSKKELTPVRRLLNLLTTEKKDIAYVYIYAITVGIISLSLPLGTQAIVSFISGGLWINSVYLLIGLVIVGIVLTGGLQIMQISMVEILQRRVFTKASLEFAYRIPRICSESLFRYYTPELMNRFFDIMTIQKGLPKLLIDLSTAILQILFGLLLLTFYHPFFIFFGLVLVTLLVLIFYFTGPKGLSSSIVESKYKYRVAFWLEELARTMNSFKVAGNTELPIRKTDHFVNNYLKNREKHFKVLIWQFSYFVAFKALISGGLLILGTILVIQRQITLGQFVASEIIILLIMNSVEKLIINLDVVYDMLTAVDKIGHVTDLPLEPQGGIHLPDDYFDGGINIKVKNLSYRYPGSKQQVLKNVNFEVKPGEHICISGKDGAGKSTLVNIIDGIYQSYEGMVTFNQVPIKDVDLTSLRDHIAKDVSHEDIFDGTVLENITVGKPMADYHSAQQALKDVNIEDDINDMPEGINTTLVSAGKTLTNGLVNKIILARIVAKQPKLIILNDFFYHFSVEERKEYIKLLTDPKRKWSLIVVSNDPYIMKAFNRILFLQDGEVVADSTYKELIKIDAFNELIFSST